MSLRSTLLFELSRRRLPKPATRTIDYAAYQDWRKQSLTTSWSAFSTTDLRGKEVLDFGCGDGALSLFLATEKSPARVTGVDLDPSAIERAKVAQGLVQIPTSVQVEFLLGSTDGLPIPDGSVDVLVAFDCLEHVMSPLPIFRDWVRVVRPGGRCLLEWFPYKGPWGPHMEALIPIPWAHVLFGQEAMFRAAERLYDLPQFVPRHWDLEANGTKKPNKWKQWSSFRAQGYINELDIKTFRTLVETAGLRVARFETHSFGGSPLRRTIGHTLMRLPFVGEYFISYTVIELIRP
jgi:SAM-dependent methyltransferase